MKLFYFKAPEGNVGDDLNEWLWPRILPNILDDDPDHLLIGIGTLLNHKLPLAKKYTVLTSGVGYGDLPRLNHGEWDFIGLRGPLSQKALNITGEISLLDGAYLLPTYYPKSKKQTYKVAYIPHVDSIINGLWQEVCDLAGIKLIDPRWPVERFVDEICCCEKVITEAMHGAIISDAYGIPWQPVKAYDYINEFKWNDWTESLQMKAHLNTLQPTWKGDEGASFKRKSINTIKRITAQTGYYPQNWTPVLPSRSSQKEIEETAKKLIAMSSKNEFYSSELSLRLEKIRYLIDVLKNKLFI